jgi:hypothetical protein
MRSNLVVLGALLCLGCGSERARVPDSAGSHASEARQSTAMVATQVTGVCPTPAGGLRLGVDSVAGIPAGLPIAELRQRCAAARVDTLYEAGGPSPALRFDFRGGTIWAVQYVPDTDTLVASQPVQRWAAIGDSLRFPDGRLIPRRLGQIRAVDSVGFMSIGYGDDNSGADVTLCRVPALTFYFDTLPAPADTSTRPFAGIRATDTSSYRRVELESDARILAIARRFCGSVAGG